MVAVDHPRISSDFPDNVVELNSHLLATISGGREYLSRDLQRKCHEYEVGTGKRASAEEVSQWMSDTLSYYSEEGLSAPILIAGWDNIKMEPAPYKVKGKGKLKATLLATGSGKLGCRVIVSLFLSIFTRPTGPLTMIEAVELAKRALCVGVSDARERHEFMSVYHIGPGGWRKVGCSDDIAEWQKQHMKNTLSKLNTPSRGLLE